MVVLTNQFLQCKHSIFKIKECITATVLSDLHNPKTKPVSTSSEPYCDMMVQSWGNSVARDRNLRESSRTNLHNNTKLYKPIVN